MPNLSFSDVRLNYDPSAPQQRFRAAGLEAAFAKPLAQSPSQPAWPADGVPKRSRWYRRLQRPTTFRDSKVTMP